MIIHNNIEDLNIENPVLTIGVFDGVHQGHLSILNRLKTLAKKNNGESVVLTLWPHPRIVLNKDLESLRLLNNIDEKKFLLSRTGVDHLIIIPFTKEFSQLNACEFIEEYLVKKIHVKHLVVGYNHQFGKDRKAGYEFLKECSDKFGFEIEKLDAKLVNDESVSSTKIREFLVNGELEMANNYLGYEYFVSGNVVEGNKIGRTIGFPTANIEFPEPWKQIPKDGVYAVRVMLNNSQYIGMLNIGTRPTVEPVLKIKNMEVHIFNFDDKIYNQTVTLSFVKRIRDEKKFAGLNELKVQLHKDKEQIQRLFDK
ncbi:MAG: riboflavin biosynthesis protein RibF [Bacteroidetes bacterium GWF2_33_16]|nr:MAG: riboflavin biosynthesis protein RibF [Bacteroidetes bacterium GWE2_32_14]OFY07704.1 MAG: riboflavin biosynthesis protein RibF [Bacteroidetes bacterium GWF2_33_16]